MITIGLPLYKAQHTAFIALEGLCRQDTDSEWELIVVEEDEEALGRDRLLEYKNRLEAAGCQQIKHLQLKNWIPLSEKWHEMTRLIGRGSIAFLLQAGDNYPNYKRIEAANDIFEDGRVDMLHSKSGFFYDIHTGTTCIAQFPGYNGKMGMDKSFSTKLFKHLPRGTRRSGVDGWIKRCIRKQKGTGLKVYLDKSYIWMYGLNTNGVNHITTDRSEKMQKSIYPYATTNNKPSIPEEVFDKIKGLRQ